MFNYSYAVTWIFDAASVANVKIELLKGGVLNHVISASTPNDGSYTWTIPLLQASGTDYRVRITGIESPSIADTSDANFTINYLGYITVTSPNGGENWARGSLRDIVWQSDIGGNVRIDLYKGGVWNSQIIGSTPNDGLHPWSISSSQIIGADYTVRVTSVESSLVFDSSNMSFSINAPTMAVTSPNGGEIWGTGSLQSIVWTSNAGGTVKIELLKGGVFHQVISASTQNSGTFDWLIHPSALPGNDYRIRVTSNTNSSWTDTSDANFTIIPGTYIIVSMPNGGERWAVNEAHAITWTTNAGGNVKIESSTDGGTIWTTVTSSTPSSAGTFFWTPAVASATCRIRVSSTASPSVYDESDGDFEVAAPYITLVTPNGGENWSRTLTYNIAWTSNLGGNVSVELWKGGVKDSDIATSTENDGVHSWTVPAGQTIGADYRVRIAQGAVTGQSSADFAIGDNAVIQLTSPNGGENWAATTTRDITWNSNAGGTVRIELLKAGAFFSTLAFSGTNDGSFPWTISVPTAADYTVRITSNEQSLVSDTSDNTFTVSGGYVTVNVPDGSELWSVGTHREITWSSNAAGTVKIELSEDSGATWLATPVAEEAPNTGSYDWLIPVDTTPLNTYRIRITSNTPAAWSDSSNADFSILYGSYVILEAPIGGEDWAVDSTQEIKWQTNAGGNVKLEYSADSGVVWNTIIASTPNDETYDWDLSLDPLLVAGTRYRVRITSTTDSSAFGYSASDFILSPARITVISPAVAANWYVGNSFSITWTSNLGIALAENVRIDLYKGGVLDSVIFPSTANHGSYNWMIPAGQAPGTDYTVKITSLAPLPVSSGDSGIFNLAPGTLVVTSPNGGETLRQGNVSTVSWTFDAYTGANVKIELLKGGALDSVISASTANDGSYNWMIPAGQANGADYRVRISGVEILSVSDMGDSDFMIIDEHTVTFVEGANGTITGTKVQTVNHSADCTEVSAVPNTGYHFTAWTGDYTGITNPLTVTNVTSDLDITANFAINTYTLTYNAPNGSITGTNPQTVNHGADGEQVTAVPNTGFKFVSWSDGVLTPSRTDTNVFGDLSVTANFEKTATWDFNGDGKSDIASEINIGRGWFYFMNGTLPSSPLSPYLRTNLDWSVQRIADFNGDGKFDILWNNSSSGDFLVYLMNGATTIQAKSVCEGGFGWLVKSIADFNGDGKFDILWENASGTGCLNLMNGCDIIASAFIYQRNPVWAIKQTADFNGDGKADLLWEHTDGTGYIYLMNGTSILSHGKVYRKSSSAWNVIKTGDFNGDGKADLLWEHTDGSGAIYLMNGLSISATGFAYKKNTGWTVEDTSDFNGDGKADLYWEHSSGIGSIWLMNGIAMASSGTVYTKRDMDWNVIKFLDFNGDGKTDMLWEHALTRKVMVYLMNGFTVTSTGTAYSSGNDRHVLVVE